MYVLTNIDSWAVASRCRHDDQCRARVKTVRNTLFLRKCTPDYLYNIHHKQTKATSVRAVARVAETRPAVLIIQYY